MQENENENTYINMEPTIEDFKTVWRKKFCDCGCCELIYNKATRRCRCKKCGKEIEK